MRCAHSLLEVAGWIAKWLGPRERVSAATCNSLGTALGCGNAASDPVGDAVPNGLVCGAGGVAVQTGVGVHAVGTGRKFADSVEQGAVASLDGR